jgi:hypothetical protein
MLAIELSASNTWARDIRGMQSMPGMTRNSKAGLQQDNQMWQHCILKDINKQITF